MLSRGLASHSSLAHTETETLRPERVEGGGPCWDLSASSLLLLAEPSLSRHETRDLPDKSRQGWVRGLGRALGWGRGRGCPDQARCRLTFPNTATRVLSMYCSFSIILQGQKREGVVSAPHGLWPFLAHGHGQ